MLIVVSLLTREPTGEHIRGLTFQTSEEAVEGIEPIESVGDRGVSDPVWRRHDRILSGIIIILVAIVMIYFSNLFFG